MMEEQDEFNSIFGCEKKVSILYCKFEFSIFIFIALRNFVLKSEIGEIDSVSWRLFFFYFATFACK